MRRDDIAAGLRLCRAANWNQTAADWEWFLSSSPDGCRVTVDDSGDVIATTVTIDYEQAFRWIAMVLVDPHHRRAGVGTSMLQDALGRAGERTTRLDATSDGRRVYEPLGFRPEYELRRLTRSATTSTLPAHENAMPVRSLTVRDFDDVLGNDFRAFGADRRTLLDRLRREAPEYARIVRREDGAVDGFLFGRHGHAFEHLGPLVADDEPAARALVASVLSANVDRAFLIDAPSWPSWSSWLESAGFGLQRTFIRMFRGDRVQPQNADRVFAVAGPELG